MVEVSPYDGGSGFTGGNENPSYPAIATILYEHTFGEVYRDTYNVDMLGYTVHR